MANQFFLFSGRLISKITITIDQRKKDYGFYQSTGENSLYKDTWFPFNGLRYDFYFIKPHSHKCDMSGNFNSRDFEPYFDQLFLDFIEENKAAIFKINKNQSETNEQTASHHSFLVRFGNTECMLLSYLLKKGYWESPESQLVIDFINTHYSQQLSDLQQHADQSLKEFNSPSNVENLGSAPIIIALPQHIEAQKKINLFLSMQMDNYATPIFDYELKQADYDDRNRNALELKNLLKHRNHNALKLQNLLKRCQQYQTHLNQTGTYGCADRLLEQKKNVIEDLCQIIETTDSGDLQQKLTDFTNVFDQHKSMFTKRRDPAGVFFVKAILTLLTLGLPMLFGLWKMEGVEFKEQVDEMLHVKP